MDFVYADIGRKRFEVRHGGALVGVVRELRIRHLGGQIGWEATGLDGSHRAVHEHRWQAAWALTWDGKGYPFPVTARNS